jgi:transcriptional regulator with XRE-family HTH domain
VNTDPPRLPEELGLGAAITFLRRQAGMPQRELTSKLGLSARSNLSDYERGRRLPPADIVLACEEVFGLGNAELQELRRRALDERARDSVTIPPESSSGLEPDRRQGEQARHRRSRRRGAITAVASGTFAALLAFGAIRADSGDRPAALTGRPVIPQPVHGTVPDLTHHDGDDPQITGCSQDKVTLDQVPVYLPGGAVFGRLLLRHSADCAMSWGAVWGPDPHLYRVYIVASRPADHARAASSWAANTPPGSYGNMLSTASSCVRVSAWVQTPEGNGPLARTACLK